MKVVRSLGGRRSNLYAACLPEAQRASPRCGFRREEAAPPRRRRRRRGRNPLRPKAVKPPKGRAGHAAAPRWPRRAARRVRRVPGLRAAASRLVCAAPNASPPRRRHEQRPLPRAARLPVLRCVTSLVRRSSRPTSSTEPSARRRGRLDASNRPNALWLRLEGLDPTGFRTLGERQACERCTRFARHRYVNGQAELCCGCLIKARRAVEVTA